MELLNVLNGVLATVPLWLLWPLIGGIAVYWYTTRNHNYWKNLDVPYVPAIPILGSIGKAVTNPLHQVEIERYRTKGRIYGLFEGSRPTLTIADPDVMKDIFVKDFPVFTARRTFSINDSIADKMVSNMRGEDWKRVRTLITPAFTTGKLKKMTSIFIDSAKTLSENFRKAATDGKPLDMKRFFGAFTMDVIASSAFATKIDSHNDPENPFVTAGRTVFSRNVSWRFVVFILFPSIMRLLRINPFAPGALKFFSDVTLKIVKERKQSGQRRNDFLQLMIDAEEELEKSGIPKETDEASDIGHEENNDQVFKPMRGFKSLSNDELVAQCVIFFLAGYDTTASTLSFAVYELALNPDVQEKVIDEIDESIREKGELRYETIFEMKYLDCVVSETLRKYPPAIRTERVADEDYEIKKYDIKVPKGMVVGLPIYAIHHDPEHYPNPEKFEPERFLPEEKATRHPYAYLPFGAGPRNCIAMRFALTEVKVCLAHILSQFRFHSCSETSIPLRYYMGQGLMSPKEVMLTVETRNDSPFR